MSLALEKSVSALAAAAVSLEIPVVLEKEQTINALVVDDHELVRDGMRTLLECNPKIHQVCEAKDGEEALFMATQQRFDLVLLDIAMPGLSGAKVATELLKINCSSLIIVVTGQLDGRYVQQLLNNGARGYVSKGCGTEELNKAITEVLGGQKYLSTDVAAMFANSIIQQQGTNPFDKLSQRETQIIGLLLEGKPNRGIGETLFISEKTVSTHRVRAFNKLGVSSAPELMRLAMKCNVWHDGLI